MPKNQSKKYIADLVQQNGGIGAIPSNAPTQYKSRNRQYYGNRSKAFVAARAKYADDFVQAEVQGVLGDDFYRYATTGIRLSDITSQTATSTKKSDDVKLILFQEPKIDYFPIGAKVKTMGNTWICVDPSNMSNASVTAVIQRCNASYNSYDYYGNIVTEPICVQKYEMLGNDNSTSQNIVLKDGYYNVVLQKNPNTAKLGLNQRIICNTTPFFITGFSDFLQEFSGDYDSTHIIEMTIRLDEGQTSTDDLVNHIAHGLLEHFSAEIIGASQLQEGNVAQLTAHFIHNEQTVESTEEYPITWLWSSSNAEICTVTDEGLVEGSATGQAQIVATMAQNKAITATIDIEVTSAEAQPEVRFASPVPDTLSQYDEITIEAGYYENGALMGNEVEWSFSGANARSYKVSNTARNTITIMCLRGDSTPLTVTASCNGVSATATIQLESY